MAKSSAKLPASALDAHLGYWLRLVSNHVSHAFQRKVEQLGVTVAEWVVLRKLLELAPTAPTQLAEALGMTRGAISKLDDRLLQKGLIEVRRSETDGRAQVVVLSKRGAALVPKLAALADQNDEAFFGALTREKQRALRALLLELVAAHGLAGTPVD
ncbi:MAG: MarR family transcriptional regulator [Polyangiales bacterium]